MTNTEEKRALLDAWDRISAWVKDNCRFPKTREFAFPHDTYHWTKLEIYPSGDCAILTGSHGNPGEFRPKMIHGHEEFRFGMGDNSASWYSKEEDFARYREYHKAGREPDYFDHIESYWLLRRLYDNWNYVKQFIVAEIRSDDRLREFEP